MKNSTNARFYFFILLAILTIDLNAQILKGTFRIGPSIDFSSSSTEIDGFDIEIKNTDLSLGLSAGYYIIDNFEIGLGLAYLSSTDEVDNFESNSTGLVFGPQLEYNVQLSSQFYLPIGGLIGFNSIHSEDDTGDEITYSGLSYGLWSGVEFVSNNKLGVQLSVGPQFGTLKDDDSDSEFDLTLIAANLEINFYF